MASHIWQNTKPHALNRSKQVTKTLGYLSPSTEVRSYTASNISWVYVLWGWVGLRSFSLEICAWPSNLFCLSHHPEVQGLVRRSWVFCLMPSLEVSFSFSSHSWYCLIVSFSNLGKWAAGLFHSQSHLPIVDYMAVTVFQARVLLEDMECWHLSWKSLSRGCFCILWSNVRPTYGLRHVVSPSLGPSVGKVSGTPYGTDGWNKVGLLDQNG